MLLTYFILGLTWSILRALLFLGLNELLFYHLRLGMASALLIHEYFHASVSSFLMPTLLKRLNTQFSAYLVKNEHQRKWSYRCLYNTHASCIVIRIKPVLETSKMLAELLRPSRHLSGTHFIYHALHMLRHHKEKRNAPWLCICLSLFCA
jgi:hypothetical protein